jgi:hypothetical protein
MNENNFLEHLDQSARVLLDIASYTVALGVLVQVLPVTAAAMSIIWLGLQMFAWFRRKAWQTDKERNA